MKTHTSEPPGAPSRVLSVPDECAIGCAGGRHHKVWTLYLSGGQAVAVLPSMELAEAFDLELPAEDGDA